MKDNLKAGNPGNQVKQKNLGAGKQNEHSAEMDYAKRYRLCRELMDKRTQLRELSDEEKDRIAEQIASPEYLNLTSDWAFKYLFRKHKDLLLMLLRDIINEPIENLEYRDSELVRLFAKDKKVIFDLLCTTSDGREFIVEMQKDYRSDQRDRMMFYGASLIRDQLKAGTTVYELKPVKLICLMDYEDLHERETRNKIVFQYGMVEVETCEVYGQQLTIYCVELPRVMKLTDNFDSPVAGWCRIFRNIANFAEMRDGRFGNVVKGMKVRGLDEQEMIEYFSDMVTIDDIKPFIDGGHKLGYMKGLQDGLDAGREEGREEGVTKGREEGVASIVAKLLQSGMNAETIAKATGLPIETVLSYRS